MLTRLAIAALKLHSTRSVSICTNLSVTFLIPLYFSQPRSFFCHRRGGFFIVRGETTHYYWVIVKFALITSTCIVDVCQYSLCTFNVKQELYKNYRFFTDGGAHNSCCQHKWLILMEIWQKCVFLQSSYKDVCNCDITDRTLGPLYHLLPHHCLFTHVFIQSFIHIFCLYLSFSN